MAVNQQDVRVRLTAEGVADVVEAFDRISKQAQKASKETTGAFAEISKAAKELGGDLAGMFAAGLTLEKFAEFIKGTVETGESLEKLSRQTGMSTDHLQALQRAARESNVSNEVLAAGLNKLTVNLGKAGQGSTQVMSALGQMGLSFKDLQKLSPDQQFDAIAKGLASIPDPAERAQATVALFGKSGQELQVMLKNVADNGTDYFLNHLKQLGLYLDTDTVAAMSHAGESFKQLQDTLKGVATQIAVQLIPALQQGVDELLKAASSGGPMDGFKKVGELIGDVFKGIIAVVIILGKAIGTEIGTAIATIQKMIGAAGTAIEQIKHGQFRAAFDSMVDAAMESGQDIVNEYAKLKNDVVKVVTDLFQSAAKAADKPPPPDGGGGVTEEQIKLARARLSLLQAQLDAELKLYLAQASALEEQNRAAYEQGLESLKDYYQKRAEAANAGFDKQEEILRKRIAAVSAIPVLAGDTTGEIAKQAELAKLRGEQALLEQQRLNTLIGLTDQETKDQKALADQKIQTEIKLANLAGKKREAAELELALQIQTLGIEMKRAGYSDQEIKDAKALAQARGQAKIDFDKALSAAQAALADMQSGVKGIQDQVVSGQKFAIQGEAEIIELEKKRLPLLKKLAEAALAAANAMGDEKAIAQATALNDKVKELAISTDTAGKASAAFKATLQSAMTSGITQALEDMASGAKSVGDAFKAMALTIIQALEQAAAEALAKRFILSLFGAPSTGGGAAVGEAGGGLILGPGTSTSDSIPTMLSSGEFVVKASVVNQPGMLDMLTRINQGVGLRSPAPAAATPRFAEGGAVTGARTMPVIKVVNIPDSSLMAEHLQSAEGEQAVLNIISRNPNRVRGAIR